MGWHLIVRETCLAQVGTVTGIYGLSFVMAAFNALLAWADAAKATTFAKRFGPIAVSILALIAAYGGERFLPQAQAGHFARAVQPNFPEVESYPGDWFERYASDMDDLEQLSLGQSAHAADLIVWPEAPAPFSWQDNRFSTRASSLAPSPPTRFR